MRFVRIVIVTALAGLCGLVVAIPSAPAHKGEHPHVGTAFYNQLQDVTFCKGQAVADGWHFLEKVNNLDSRLSWNPDFHVDSAPGCNIVGHRVDVQQVDARLLPCVEVDIDADPDGIPTTITLNAYNAHGLETQCPEGNGPRERWSCRSILKMLGSHQYDGEGRQGCLSGGLNAPNGSNANDDEISTLNQAYCDACRPPYDGGDLRLVDGEE